VVACTLYSSDYMECSLDVKRLRRLRKVARDESVWHDAKNDAMAGAVSAAPLASKPVKGVASATLNSFA
jgi:hypothetical protein